MKTLKIGATAPLSGPLAFVGDNLMAGLTFAIQDIESEGGLHISGERYRIEVEALDDGYIGEQAAINARRLVKSGINYIATEGTAGLLAMQPVTEAAKVMVLVAANSGIGPQSPYTFRVASTNAVLGDEFVLKYAKKHFPHARRLAILDPSSPSGKAVSARALETARRMQYEVVFSDFYDSDLAASDFRPYLSRVVEMKPDLIDTGVSVPIGGMANWMRILKSLGWQGPIGGAMASPGFSPASTELADEEGFFGYLIQDPRSRLMSSKEREIWSRFRVMYPDSNLMGYTWSFYEALTGLTLAMKKAETVETMVVRDVFADLEWNGFRSDKKLRFSGQQTFGIKRQLISPIHFGIIRSGWPCETDRILPDWD